MRLEKRSRGGHGSEKIFWWEGAGGGARNVPWRHRRSAAVGTGHCCTGGSGPQRGRFIGEAVGGIRRFGRERHRVGAAARERGTRSRRRVDEIPPLPLGVGVLSRKAQDLLGKAPGSLTLARVPASAPRMVCLSMWILPSTEIFFAVGTPGCSPARPGLGFCLYYRLSLCLVIQATVFVSLAWRYDDVWLP